MAAALIALAALAHPAPAADYTVLSGPMPLLVVGKAPPSNTTYAPAPTPNLDLTAPSASERVVAGEPKLVAHLASPWKALREGDGYAPGSAFSEEMQYHNRSSLSLSPTLGWKIPINTTP